MVLPAISNPENRLGFPSPEQIGAEPAASAKTTTIRSRPISEARIRSNNNNNEVKRSKDLSKNPETPIPTIHR